MAATLLIASCAQASPPGRPGASSLGPASGSPAGDLRGEWRLIGLTRDGFPVPLPADGEGTLILEAGDLGGRSFCNGFSSTYRLDGEALTIDGLGGTEMACAPDLMAAERDYLDALGRADTVVVEGGQLVLRGQGAELTFQRLPPGPVRDLVGTRWVLETLVHEDMASSTVGGPAVLVLAADGVVSGSTGCRTLTGRWARTGEDLVFPQLRADGDCSSAVRGQDEHVLAVLHEETTAAVDGDLLEVTAPNGMALVYRAEG
jgi:heat shock protein HslJ